MDEPIPIHNENPSNNWKNTTIKLDPSQYNDIQLATLNPSKMKTKVTSLLENQTVPISLQKSVPDISNLKHLIETKNIGLLAFSSQDQDTQLRIVTNLQNTGRKFGEKQQALWLQHEMNRPDNGDINVGRMYVPVKGIDKLLALEYASTRKGEGNEANPLPANVTLAFYDTEVLKRGIEQGILRWGYRFDATGNIESGEDCNFFSIVPRKDTEANNYFSNAYIGSVTFTSK